MKERKKKEKLKGRQLALTILIGVFLAIMIATLFNLIVTYFYEIPQYDDFCGNIYDNSIYKYNPYSLCSNCTFPKELQNQSEVCGQQNGITVYEYDEKGCAISIKECNFCSKEFETAEKTYNMNTFFIYALIGFALVVIGLFIPILLIQITSLPAGAFLVIEAAVKNFDDKLYVIITFSLLIIAAIYLALKKLR
jgi:hypothetical protein